MSPRYIFNTAGEYVAFVQNGCLFSSDCEWLGVIVNGNEVFNTEGQHVGFLLTDDRIARDKRVSRFRRIARPARPARPPRPARPLRRLRMVKMPYPYEDVFSYPDLTKLHPAHKIPSFDHLLGAHVIAHDNQSLGVISTSRYDQNSLSNEYGHFGNKYSATSILNEHGRYGGKYSALSPFNEYSSTPPKIVKNGTVLGTLTVNRYASNQVDPNELLEWLSSRAR